MDLNDLFFKINNNLINLGYTNIKNVSYEVLENSIKGYLIEKLNLEKTGEYVLTDLINQIANHIPKDKRQLEMAKLTHFLLNILSGIQDFEIIWYIDKEAKQPYLKRSEFFPDKYDALVSSEDFDYMKTFQIVLEKLREIPVEIRGRV